jgi:iron complex outermembrane receptor protein
MELLTKSSARARLMTMAATAALLAPAAAHAQAQVGEIIVTAQRRAERLQDVPISVTAVTPENLKAAGITSTRELSMVTPGLRIEAGGAYVQATVRGIGTNQTVPTAESNVATYVDGVYQQTMVSAIYALPDVQQVEVLKGPQGTLFGRNATGGAILINTVQPDLNKVTGAAAATFGNFDSALVRGYATVPLIQDKVAVGLTISDEHQGGYKHNVLANHSKIGHVDDLLVRGKLRFLPWTGADFTLTGLYSYRRDYTALKNTNWNGNNLARALGVPASQIASKPLEFGGNTDPFLIARQKSISLRGNIEVGPGTLTTTTAYNKVYGTQTSDSDNSVLPLSYLYIPNFSRAFQQELVYSTNQMGPWHAVVGAFYFDSNGGLDPLNINNFAQAIYTRDKVKSYAAFGEVTYDATERLRLTAGLRYSHDKANSYVALTVGTHTPPATIPPLTGGGEAKWHAWTPRLSALYKVTDHTNVYATYSQGYRAGTFNAVSFQAAPVNPEKVRAYEVGVKSNEVSNLSLNAAGFFYDYKDLQLPTIISLGGSAVSQQLRNAAKARIYGAEVSGTWLATEELTLSFGATWLHARYNSFPNAVVNVPTGAGGNKTVSVDASGNTMIRSPSFSGNLTAQYVHETNAGRFDAAATIFYSSKLYFEIGDRVVQPAYAQLNGHLGYSPPGTNLEVRLWGKNLTNHPVIYATTITTTADGVNYSPPRTYGIELSYKY